MAKKATPATIEHDWRDLDNVDPTTHRCVSAMREVIAQLLKGDGKTGLTEFADSASAPAEGRYATRELQITIVTTGARQ